MLTKIMIVCVFVMVGMCRGIWLETYRAETWKVPEDTWHELPISLRFNQSDLKNYVTHRDLRKYNSEVLNSDPITLKFSDLQSSYLQSSDLQSSDLQPSDLQSSDLQSSDLQSSDLQPSDLQFSDLQSSDLQPSDLQFSDLQSSDLQPSDLQFSDLQSSDLQSSDLQPSDLRSNDLQSDLTQHDLRKYNSEFLNSVLRVTVVPDEEWKLSFVNRSVVFSVQDVLLEANKTLEFSGYYWGSTKLKFYLTQDDLNPGNNGTLLRDDMEITIDRKSYITDTTFIIVGSILVLFNNINMGAQLDLDIIVAVLKRPVGPICGFVSQFAVMPLATYLMGWLLFTDPLERLGLFTLGCCPGGTSSNFWTLMFNGNINLSITMTAISTLAAMGMMPLWLGTLGQRLLDDVTIKIPFLNLAGSLVAFTVPVGVGMLIRYKRPLWAEKGARALKPFSFFILLFFMVVGTYNSYKVIQVMTWQMVVAGLMVMFLGYSLGAVLAKLVCLPKDMIIAVSIETALQNPGVAFVLLKITVESPYSDLASLPIIAVLMVSGLPLLLAFLIYSALRRWCGCCPDPTLTKEPLEVDEKAREIMLNIPDTK